MSLNINEGGREREEGQREPLGDNIAAGPGTEARPHINQHNHFFHFDGEAFLYIFTQNPDHLLKVSYSSLSYAYH